MMGIHDLLCMLNCPTTHAGTLTSDTHTWHPRPAAAGGSLGLQMAGAAQQLSWVEQRHDTREALSMTWDRETGWRAPRCKAASIPRTSLAVMGS